MMNGLEQHILEDLQSPVWAALLSLAVLWCAAAGIGRIVLREKRSGFIGTALGTGILAAAGLLLPLGDLPGWLSLALLVPFALWGIWGFRHIIGGRLPVWGWVITAAALFTLASALFPPYSWDEQVYQIALPVEYLRDGGSFFRADNPYSGFSDLPHFFLLWGMKTGGMNLPRLTVWLISLMLAAVLWLELRRYGRFFALAAVSAVVLSPLWVGCSRSFYQEWFIALYGMAGVLVLFRDGDKKFDIAAAGILAGCAVAVKLTGGGAALALTSIFFCRKRNWRDFLIFALTAMLTALIFYLRPWIVCGDPFYPFGTLLTGGGDPVAAAVAEYHHALGSYRFGLDGLPGVFLGWIFAAFDRRIYDGAVTGIQLPFAVLLIGGGALLLRRRGDAASEIRRIWDLAIAGGMALYLFWSLTSQQVRFLLPVLPLAAWGIAASLPQYGRRCKIAVVSLLLLTVFCSMPFNDIRHHCIAWKNLAGARSAPAAHLAAVSRDPGYFMMAAAAAKLPPETRMLLLFERRTLYWPLRNSTIGDSGFQAALFTPPPETAEAFFAALDGFDYIMAGGSPVEIDYLEKYEPWREQMKSLLAQGVHAGRLRPVERFGEYWMFKINDLPEKDGIK